MGIGGGGEGGEGGGGEGGGGDEYFDSPKCRCKNLSDRHHLSNTKICPEMLSRHKTHYPVKFSLQYHSNPLYRIGMI